MYKLAVSVIFFLCFTTHCIAQSAAASGRKANTMLDVNSAAFYQNNKMNWYDIKYLKLEITAQPQSTFITGICSYKVIVKQLLDTFAIEFKQNMSLDSVFVNNTKQSFTRGNDHIYIAINPAANTGAELNIKFYYKGTVAAGLYAGIDASNGLQYSATVSESFQSREWFPAKQLLNDKIDSTDIWITTNAAYKAGAEGLLKQVVDLPGNLKQYRWACRYPLSYYMPSIAVGNYLEYDNYAKPAAIAPDSILVQHYVVNNTSYFNNNKALIDKTPRYIEKFSELFGLYPFYKEKYGHSQADIGGGMEHATMTTLSSFDEKLVAHELAHQWFGDNVTCATWNDIWLNESFATYGHILLQEKLPLLFPNSAASEMSGLHQNIMSAPGGSVYVPLSESYNESRIFDGRLSYNKGAAVIHNLRFEMQNDTLFFNTLKTYQQRFKDTFATTADFERVAEQVSGKNFTQFFKQWIYGEGYPTYDVTYYKLGPDTLVLKINQTVSMPSVTPLFTGLMEYRIKSSQGDTIVKLNQTANTQTFKILYSKTPSDVEIDPNNWVINMDGAILKQSDSIPPEIVGVKISPNPARSIVKIEFAKGAYETLRIINARGETIQVVTLPPGLSVHTVHMSLPAGAYFFTLLGKNRKLTKKVIIINK